MITINSQRELGGMNPVMRRHLELQIKTVQNAPRDAAKLEQLLKVKQRQNDEATHVEDTKRLVTEIEMLKVVLYLVCRNNDMCAQRQQATTNNIKEEFGFWFDVPVSLSFYISLVVVLVAVLVPFL
jgi:hypothetical protein